MNIILNTVLVILSILYVCEKLKLKLLNSFSTQKLEYFENLEKNEPNFLSAKNQVLILLYDSQTNNYERLNQELLKNVLSYLKAIIRFDKPSIDF